MRWYKREPNRWFTGTRNILTLEEKGFYADLIEAYMDRDGDLPNDSTVLARTSGCRPQSVKRLLLSLLKKNKVRVDAEGKLIPNGCELTLKLARNSEKTTQFTRSFGQKTQQNQCPIPTESRYQNLDIEGKPSITRTRAKSAPSKTSLPESWQPQLTVEEGEEFERFKDHARANDRRCVDWEAAWRNWKRSPYRSKGGNGNGRVEPKNDPRSIRGAFDRLFARLEQADDQARGVPRQANLRIISGGPGE